MSEGNARVSPTSRDLGPQRGSAADLIAADRDHVIHGFSTLSKENDSGPIFKSASGIHIETVDGTDWIDGSAGQANVNLGYGRDDLIDVVGDALRELCFGTTFYHRRGHAAGASLAARLAAITPGDLNRFFFGLSGSDVVETAIKLARFVNVANGRPEKVHVIGRRRSYHGVTFGALSLSGDPKMWANVGPRLEDFSHIEQPQSDGTDAARELEKEINRLGADRVAAFMAEPISTPNGIVVPAADYWPEIREICDRYDVMMIADEVLTGFGRTGKMFAIENWNVTPDMLTMSKGITAGYYPLSVLSVGEKVASLIEASDAPIIHGVTSSGHPAGCAVAMAVIDIMERENVLAQAIDNGDYLRRQLSSLAEAHPALIDASVRGIGMLAAVDIDVGIAGQDFGPELQQRFLDEHLFAREYLDARTVGLMPSLTCTHRDIDEIVERMDRALADTEASRLAPLSAG